MIISEENYSNVDKKILNKELIANRWKIEYIKNMVIFENWSFFFYNTFCTIWIEKSIYFS